MPRKSFIDSLRVEKPCSEPWEEMFGNDQVRFCSHCAKNVNFVTAMTRKEVRKLVKSSNGSLCLRYRVDAATGGPMFAERLVQITKRAPRLAAGVVGATLGLASLTYSQSGSEPVVENVEITESADREKVADSAKQTSGTSALSGILVDQYGAVIPGVSIRLTETRTHEERTVSSDSSGAFKIEGLPAGNYHLEATASGFKTAVIAGLDLAEGTADFRTIDLEIGEPVVFTSGLVMSVAPEKVRAPLASAVYSEELEAVLDLLARGEDPDQKDSDGDTPLFISVEDGTTDIAEALLKFRADADVRNIKGENALFRIDEDTPIELLKAVIDAGADVNAENEEGITVLMNAAENASAQHLRMLLDSGAEVNRSDKNGWTALMKAAYEDDVDKVRMLLLAGARVNDRNDEGENAWDQSTDDDVDALLVSFGSEISEPKVEDTEPEPQISGS